MLERELGHENLQYLPVSTEPFSKYVNYSDSLGFVITTVIICLTAFCILMMIRRKPDRKIFLVGILCFTIFLEMHHYFNTVRYERTEIFQESPDYISFLKKNLNLNRVAAYGSSGLPPEVGTAYQLQQIEFFTMNIFPSYYAFCQKNLTTEHGWWGKDTFCVNRDTASEPNINLSSLNLLAVKYIIVSRAMNPFLAFFDRNKFPRVFETALFTIFENPQVFPRVYAVTNIQQAPLTPDTQGQNANAVVFTEDQKLLSEAQQKGISMGPPTGSGPAEIFTSPRLTAYENTHIAIEANFDVPGILVLPDNWHPNWKALDNGKPAYIGKVNQSFRGLALAAGTHKIEMHYQPATLPLALGISGLVSSLLAGLFIMRRRFNGLFRIDP